MRYFQTKDPDISISAKGNRIIRWTLLDGGGGPVAGVHATSDSAEITAIENCIRRKVGGRITEISETEFDGLKKKPWRFGDRPNERRGISGPEVPDTMSHSPPPPPPPAGVVAVPATESPPPPPPPDEPVKVGKRKAK